MLHDSLTGADETLKDSCDTEPQNACVSDGLIKR